MKRRLSLLLCTLMLLALPLSCALASEPADLFSDKDLTVADPAKAVNLSLTGDGVDITQEGVYRLSGRVEDGSIRVSLEQEGTVWLLLDGVEVHNEDGAALTSTGCQKLILTLADGSVNALTQGAAEPAAEDNDAAIYVRDDLTINGAGSLTVESAWMDGINCRDSLRIVDGQIAVTAVDDGIVGKDEVTVGGGTVSVIAQSGDGIKATNAEEAERGFVTIAGGNVTVTTGGGAETSASEAYPQMQPEAVDAPSQKGVKAETLLTVSGGSVTVVSADDALHAAEVLLSGGTLTLSSGDDGVHADGTLTVSGGTINVLRAYEGLEATDMFLSGGSARIAASDDGINGAGGDAAQEDGGAGTGRFGRDRFSASTGTLTISGGTFYVSASGDGVDVNGDIVMSGGELYVNGPASSGNGALDYDGGFTLTGGTLAAVGAAGMAQGVSAPSIPGAAVSLSGSGALEVLDAAGSSVLRFEAEGDYSHAVLYSDRFTDGESYIVTSGGQSQTVQMSAQPTGGGFGGGGFGGGGRPEGGRPEGDSFAGPDAGPGKERP